MTPLGLLGIGALVLLAGCGKPEVTKVATPETVWAEPIPECFEKYGTPCAARLCPKVDAAWEKYFKSGSEADLAAARKTTDEDWCYAADAPK
jgi:hypothetical protein